MREPSWVIAYFACRMSSLGPWDPRLISVRSVVQIHPGPLGKHKPRKVLRPSGFCCYTKYLRAITLAVTLAWFSGRLSRVLAA